MEPSETISVRTRIDLGKLPATVSIELPIDIGLSLIRRRLCSPVADRSLEPDLSLVDDGDLDNVGCDLWTVAA
jgi:hypothetical protein